MSLASKKCTELFMNSIAIKAQQMTANKTIILQTSFMLYNCFRNYSKTLYICIYVYEYI